ncbi:hypothetical protein SDC9_81949 [bioreactor metagenome]|uniref:Uncharacterized protein n=1 Tax=bioreactor metagenome TaxID=1076179 RepID=A0A644Z510_9ZZZZ
MAQKSELAYKTLKSYKPTRTGATGGIFRLGCGLLALRAARALACAAPPRKTPILRRFFIAASNPSES